MSQTAYLTSMAIINGKDMLKTVKDGFLPVIRVRLGLSPHLSYV